VAKEVEVFGDTLQLNQRSSDYYNSRRIVCFLFLINWVFYFNYPNELSVLILIKL
jgi:hypothetical protein